jgi:myosin heavy subunit
MVSMDRVWVPHPEEVWVPGQTKSPNADPVVFECMGVGNVSVPKAKATGLLPAHDDQLAGIDNICNLGEVSEGAVLQTVKNRYLKKEVYTRVAKILIACNPFTAIPIYGSSYVEKYSGASDSLDEPPHVFGIGCDVLKGMR